MGWLHAWIGFVAGLILVGIFATGALAVFDTELTRWMQPEMPHIATLTPGPAALEAASREIATQEDLHHRVFMSLPSSRDPVLRVTHMDHDVVQSTAYDPETGAVIPLRDTAGGLLFFNFHYTLHMGRLFGVILVQVVGIGLMVTLGSGVIIHLKSLLPNLVVFRPRATSPRPWVDAHVLAAVLFLPFLFMAPYTGVLIHANRFFPATATERPDRGPPKFKPAPLPPLAPIVADAVSEFGENSLGFMQFSGKAVSVYRADSSEIRITRDHIDYDRVTGERMKLVRKSSPVSRTSQFLSGLHMARWAPATVRWLYFVSGMAGYVMFATGLVMFLLKRRRTAAARPSLAMNLAEGLTVGTVLGMPVACASVLWMNRLLPASLSSRLEIETSALFVVWAIMAIHGMGRGGEKHILRGWMEQATLLAALLILLPLLDIATRWQWMNGQDQTVYLAVDATACLLGLMAFHLRRVLVRKMTSPPASPTTFSAGVAS